MPPAVDLAVVVLLRTAGRDRDEPGARADDRQAVLGNPVLRRPADDLAPAERREPSECETHPATDAAHGGQPPAVVYFNQIETDQQGQKVA